MYKLNKCPYCGAEIFLKENDFIYKKRINKGYVYVCGNYPQCNSYVGTHSDKKPLGRLANKSLRNYKKTAHLYFDTIWRYKKNVLKDYKARGKAYKWLASVMSKKAKDAHIGHFNEEETKKVIDICKPYYLKIIRRF